MIDQESEAFKAATRAYWTKANEYDPVHVDDDECLAAAIKAYEAARPKLPTITGLPAALPDGTRIVGWKWGAVSSGDWIVSDDEADNPSVAQVRQCHGVYMALIAITEADNG